MTAGAILLLGSSGSDQAALAGWSYQRSAILQGELWRLVTGHLVHYSTRHLVSNLLAFIALASWLEIRIGWRNCMKFLLGSMLFISAALWLLVPEMEVYAGISGINYALLGVLLLRESSLLAQQWRMPVHVSYPVFIVASIGLLYWQAPLISSPFSGQLADVRVAWQAHAAGLSAALWLATQRHDCTGFPRARRQHDTEGMSLR